MSNLRLIALLLSWLLIFATPIWSQNTVYHSHAKPEKATLKMAAILSRVHSGYDGDQDTYLAELLARHDDRTSLVKLVDSYPDGDCPIRLALLETQPWLSVIITRDDTCDDPNGLRVLSQRAAHTFDLSAS